MKILIDILESYAKGKKTINYRDLLTEYNRKIDKRINKRQLFELLNEVGSFCIDSGRPPLNCLAVNELGIPGIGFYPWLGNKFNVYVDYKKTYIMIMVFKICRGLCFNHYNNFQGMFVKKNNN